MTTMSSTLELILNGVYMAMGVHSSVFHMEGPDFYFYIHPFVTALLLRG